MGRKTSLVSLKEIGEINLTPLMDLTFILLITFIITFPLIENGIPVNLPTANAAAVEPEESVSISLDKEGGIFMDDQPVTLEILASELTAIGMSNPDMPIMVRADEELAYKKVVQVMHLLQEAKLSKMALVTKSGKTVGGK